MNVISTTIGIVALLIALVGIIPLLGWLNWLALVGAVTGLVFGLFAEKTNGRNVNIVVLVLAIFRLTIGGGII